MFNLTADRQRTHSQPFSHQYYAQDYQLPPDSAPIRADFSPHSGGNIYHIRESLSPDADFNPSYDHRPSASGSHGPPSVLYHGHGYIDSVNTSKIKRVDMSNTVDNFSISNSHITFRHPTTAVTGASSEHSGDSDSWPNSSPGATQGNLSKPRKSRREKPHIELAPGQPPTTQGKPRARVYVACLQCRTRKIRCDGANPVCHNCGRRANGHNECNYDPIPKRRGPDKTPGARQRMARDVRNEIENNSSTRRRRRARDNPTYGANHTTHKYQTKQTSIPEPPQSRMHVSGNSILLSVSPESPGDYPTSGFLPVSEYLSSSSPCACHGLTHCPDVGGISNPRKSVVTTQFDVATINPPYSGSSSRGYIAELDENWNELHNSHSPDIGSQPSLNFTRKVWWDSLLSLYFSPTSTRLQILTVSQRESAARGITSDLRFLFRTADYWLSFFHIPSFFDNFFDPGRRERLQPSLVLALLALSTFWRSSEVGYGKQGRERALRFRDEAQAAMDASFNAGWIDETLAQTAWLLALFEICSHPRHSAERTRSSMAMLDSIICSLSLTVVDADNPSVPVFTSGTVPVVSFSKPRAVGVSEQPLPCASSDAQHVAGLPTHTHTSAETDCNCSPFSLGERWPSASDNAPLWRSTPGWDETWSEGDIRRESCRRLCWSSMVIAAGFTSYNTAQRTQWLDLFIADPANYALLFSGQSMARSPALSNYSSKDTIWALHDRCFLLWHSCVRMRNSKVATENDKAEFAVKAWIEADNLEQALNRHACAVQKDFIFHALEYIFNTRMFISNGFQRSIPLVPSNVGGLYNRNMAEEWLTHQATVAEHFMSGLHTTSNSKDALVQRPFLSFCFMGQIHRALSLWEYDNTFKVPLNVCKALITGLDYLTALWPSDDQRYRYESLREGVVNSCFIAGVEAPPALNLTLHP